MIDSVLYDNTSITISLSLTNWTRAHIIIKLMHVMRRWPSSAPVDLSVSGGLRQRGWRAMISPVAFYSLFWKHRRHFHKKRTKARGAGDLPSKPCLVFKVRISNPSSQIPSNWPESVGPRYIRHSGDNCGVLTGMGECVLGWRRRYHGISLVSLVCL